ncbi:MAG: hypothetical protein IKW45_03750 [Clostridia bacterium]|nr:hypothetical protein [Clostridia bacterium]
MSSKFKNPNADGQIAKDCIYFDWTSKNHCDCERECVVLKNKFCVNFDSGAVK